MSNFINKRVLVDKEGVRKGAKELGGINVHDKNNLIQLHDINFGQKASYQIGLIEGKKNLDTIKTEFKLCYQSLMKYLQKNLPHNITIIADVQYMHRSKRLDENAVPAIQRVAKQMFSVLKRTKFSDLSLDR